MPTHPRHSPHSQRTRQYPRRNPKPLQGKYKRPQRPPSANSEVADAFWVPLAELRDPTIYRDATVHLRGESRVFPAYHLSQGVVWGLTERILTPLLDLL